MDKMFEWLSENYKKSRHTISYLFGLLCFSIIAGFFVIEGIEYGITTWNIPHIKDFIIGIGVSPWIIKVLIVVFIILTVIYNWISWRIIPKIRTSKVGIFLVPYFPDEQDSKTLDGFIIRFKSDLLLEIGEIADIEIIDNQYYVEELSKLYKEGFEGVNKNDGKKLKRVEAEFEKIRCKKNVSYILYFDCLKRDAGEKIEIRNIRQLALHPKTSKHNQDLLSHDMVISVPKGLVINSNNEMAELNSVMGILGPHLAYITSITLFLDGSYEKCIEHAKKAFFYKGAKSKVFDRASSIIAEAYIARSEEKIKKMYSTGNFSAIDSYLEDISLAMQHKHSSYSTALLLGIGYFLKNFTTPEARRAIKKGLGPQTTGQEWLLSLTFLDLWDGKYDDAFKKINDINWDNKLLSNPIMLKGILEFNDGVKKAKDHLILDFWSAVVSKKMGSDSNFGYYQNNIKKIKLPVVLKDYIAELDK